MVIWVKKFGRKKLKSEEHKVIIRRKRQKECDKAENSPIREKEEVAA
jgi:hypothetical protein